MAWNEYGDPGGRPVMYYHGWPSSRLQARLVHHLAKQRGLRLISMDRPGIGLSTIEERRKLESWPELMNDFADYLGIDRFGQLGVSGGGPYVLACAAKLPDRLTASAVLGGAPLLTEVGRETWRQLHPLYRMILALRKLPGILFSPAFRLAALSTHWNPCEVPLSLVVKTLPRADQQLLLDHPEAWFAVCESFREGIRNGGGHNVMTDAAIYFHSSELNLAEIQHPIRYWHGSDDKNIPLSMIQAFVAKIPNASLEIAEGLGHFSAIIRLAPAALDHLAQAGS